MRTTSLCVCVVCCVCVCVCVCLCVCVWCLCEWVRGLPGRFGVRSVCASDLVR